MMSRCYQILLTLAAVLAVAQTQTPQAIDGAIVFTVASNVQVLTVYVNDFTVTGSGQGIQTTLLACVQLCVNAGPTSCRSLAYDSAVSTGNNCILSTTCQTTSPNVITSSVGFDFMVFTELCPDKVSGRFVSLTGQALSSRTGGATFTNGGAVGSANAITNVGCALVCDATATCIAAEFSTTNSECTHFIARSSDPVAPVCPASTVVSTSTLWIKPCNYGEANLWCDTVMSDYGTGQSGTASNFEACLSSCTTSATCVGIRYSTSAEYDGATGLSTRCQQYVATINYPTGSAPALCSTAPVSPPVAKMWAVRKNICKDVANLYTRSESKTYQVLATGTTASSLMATAASNERQCAISCAQSATCFAYVYSTNPFRVPSTATAHHCWHNMNEVNECEKAVVQTAAATFSHNRMQSSCQRAIWDVKKNSLVTPVASTSNLVDFAACAAACTANCNGFTWNVESKQCSILNTGACTTPGTVATSCTDQIQVSAFRKNLCAVAAGYKCSCENATRAPLISQTFTTEEACIAGCTAGGAGCGAALWNRDTSACHFFTSALSNPCDGTEIAVNSILHSTQTQCSAVATSTADYKPYPDRRLLGATVQPGDTTLALCQASCKAAVGCVGIDWNKLTTTAANARCWHHFEANGGCNEPLNTTIGTPCCDHYQRTPSQCSVENSFYVFQLVNMATPGALQTQVGYTACRDACKLNKDCESFDINSGNECRFYTKSNMCGSLVACATCAHYRNASFECTWKFVKTKLSGGMGVSVKSAGVTALTVAACEASCRVSINCQGYDYDPTANTPCFLHLAATICSNRISDNRVTHYRVRTIVCAGEPVMANYASMEQNVHTVGNDLIGSGFANSAVDCLKQCSTVKDCAGIDYDKKTYQCYMAKRNNACRAGIPDTCCDRIPLLTGCLAKPVIGYTAASLQHRLKGTLAKNGTTPETCAAICTADAGCASFDYNRNTECWIHSNTQECRNVNLVFKNNCCDHYVKTTQTCGTKFVVPTFTGYNLAIKVHVQGGIQLNKQNTEALCTTACNANTTCQAVDFNFKDNTCWSHTNICRPTNLHEFVHRYVSVNATCP